MARLVNEVDAIEKDPKLATDEDHTEPYQSPVAFEARIPVVDVPERLRLRSHPLSGRRIAANTLTEEEQQKQMENEDKLADGEALYTDTEKPKLDAEELTAFDTLLAADPGLGEDFRASIAVGDETKGAFFNNLDFLKTVWKVRTIRTDMADGALVYLAVSYENGLLVERGAAHDKARVTIFGPFLGSERINSASIEQGRPKSTLEENGKDTKTYPMQVLGLRLFTNRGRSLIARALKSEIGDKGIVIRDGVAYENVKVQYLDMPFNLGTIKGFFGRSDDSSNGKIYRLGIIWSRSSQDTAGDTEEDFADTGDTVNSQDDQQVHDIGPVLQSQCGSFMASDKGWQPGENSSAKCQVDFPRRYSAAPKLLYGLNEFDAERSKPRCLSLAGHEVSAGGFSVTASSGSGCIGNAIGCSWLTLPNDLHLETGILFTGSAMRASSGGCDQQIWFSQAFISPPNICVWFQEIEWHEGYNAATPLHAGREQEKQQQDLLKGDWLSIKCFSDTVTSNSFHLKIESWAGRKFTNARVQWIAYPAEQDGKRVRSGRASVSRVEGKKTNRLAFDAGSFKDIPNTFVAISELDFSNDQNLRFSCSASAPNNTGFDLALGTWDSSNMDHGAVQWLAIE